MQYGMDPVFVIQKSGDDLKSRRYFSFLKCIKQLRVNLQDSSDNKSANSGSNCSIHMFDIFLLWTHNPEIPAIRIKILFLSLPDIGSHIVS
jgi:hypothetical protein